VEASSLGVYEDVAFAGVQSDVRPFIAAFDVFALVSFTEAFSLAALEAMAMGIPAVLSDVGGAREMVVDGETGFVFQTDDVEQFIAAMNALRENDTAKVMGMAAHRFVNAHFTHKSMVDRYEQLFGALVPQGMRDRR
jgi:glycosyltransferase involved in cell wall biosynthesis